MITPETITAVLGVKAPLANVQTNWPLVEQALVEQGIDSDACQVAAIATIGVETGCFAPIKERGGPAYFSKLYDGRADLGNTQPGDGALFRGRGFVQITGRSNYQVYGAALGLDLVGNPDLALDPVVSARILALYFRKHLIDHAALAGAWSIVRRRVNGGLNGWADFIGYVQGLEAALRATVTPPASPPIS